MLTWHLNRYTDWKIKQKPQISMKKWITLCCCKNSLIFCMKYQSFSFRQTKIQHEKQNFFGQFFGHLQKLLITSIYIRISNSNIHAICILQRYITLMKQDNKKSLRIKYFTCKQNQQHEGEALNYVCLHKNCHKNRLICSVCKFNHVNHNIVPLKMLLSELQNYQSPKIQSTQLFQCQLEQLENTHQMLLYQLTITVEKLAEQFRKLQEHITQQFTKAKIALLERVHIWNSQVQTQIRLGDFMKQVINNQIESRQTLEIELRRIIQIVSTNQKQQITLRTSLDEIVEQFKKFQEYTSKQLDKTLKSINPEQFFVDVHKLQRKQKEEKSIKQGKQPGKKILAHKNADKTVKKYIFSANLKAPSITLSEGSLQAKQTLSGKGRFVFCDKNISGKSPIIKFKIVKLANWVGIGVGLKQKIQSLKFNFEYSNLGHGSYLVSSNGYSWSHSEKNANTQSVPFTFKQGDIIQVKYTYLQVIFTNLSTKKTFEMKVRWSLEQNAKKGVYFCANLCTPGDTVQIIN